MSNSFLGGSHASIIAPPSGLSMGFLTKGSVYGKTALSAGEAAPGPVVSKKPGFNGGSI